VPSLTSLPRQTRGLLVSAATSAELAAAPSLPPGRNKHFPLPPGHIHQSVHEPSVPVPVHTVVAGGMPGWQIALIAIGAALLAGITAVLVQRAWAARRRPVTPAA
jgi:hypothetical protein